MSGYASYGNCGGDPATYTDVVGRMNAIQAKQGRYNLDFTFTNLTPGATYRLWGNNGSWFSVAVAVADATGAAKFSYQTTSPAGLGFDLNLEDGNITVVTSYWSGQLLVLNPENARRGPAANAEAQRELDWTRQMYRIARAQPAFRIQCGIPAPQIHSALLRGL